MYITMNLGEVSLIENQVQCPLYDVWNAFYAEDVYN